MTYCKCNYPVRKIGRDVLTGEPVFQCDGCGWRSDADASDLALLEPEERALAHALGLFAEGDE